MVRLIMNKIAGFHLSRGRRLRGGWMAEVVHALPGRGWEGARDENRPHLHPETNWHLRGIYCRVQQWKFISAWQSQCGNLVLATTSGTLISSNQEIRKRRNGRSNRNRHTLPKSVAILHPLGSNP